jgi:predicted nucleic acid-binding Zn ribbon protein
MTTYRYECVLSTCGHVELTTYAPQATRKCPHCGGMMKRVAQ